MRNCGWHFGKVSNDIYPNSLWLNRLMAIIVYLIAEITIVATSTNSSKVGPTIKTKWGFIHTVAEWLD